MIFPGGSVTPGCRKPNVWTIDREDKTKNCYTALQVYFQHLNKNSISLFLAGFSLKFVTWFLAGST